jgi:hypothetical protein
MHFPRIGGTCFTEHYKDEKVVGQFDHEVKS